jgi:uncharacterized phage protein gp47/JayE
MKPIPSIVELQQQLTDDFRNKLNLSDDDLKRTLNAFSLVISAQLKYLYLYLSNIQDNVFPDTANTTDQGGTLERLGAIYLNRPPFSDSIGVFNASVTGVQGSFMRSELTFKSNEDALNAGQMYVLDYDYNVDNSEDTAAIEIRSLGGGATYNLNVGDKLTITEPVIGLDKTITITAVTRQPISGETTENYREAILRAIQLEPQGGAKSDYRQWASDAEGVRLVYPYVRDANPGIVDVYVEATLENGIDGLNGNGIPTTATLNQVSVVIEQDPDVSKPDNERGRRPIQANVITSPITLVPVDVNIKGLNMNTPAIQDVIKSSIKDMLYNIRPFIAGADLLRNKNDILYSGKVQGVVTDALTNGNFFNQLTILVDGNSVSSYEFDLGNVPYLRNLTFVI